MNIQPLLDAPLAIQVHVATVVPAAIIGAWLLLISVKGSPVHRAFGAVYLTLMTLTSVAAIFIKAHVGPTFMGFGLIHLVVLLTFFAIFNAIRGIQTRNIPRHRRAVIVSYIAGILVAGGLTLIPGRMMHAVVFG